MEKSHVDPTECSDRRVMTDALRAAAVCIRVARALEETDPRRSSAYYQAAWRFFAVRFSV